MSEKRCMLCNRPYDYNYKMFGRGCLDNLYELLEISKPPRIIGNKENYLCSRIAWRNYKFFLSKKKKYALTQNYIALNYLNRMNYYNFLDDIKEKFIQDINNISIFSPNMTDTSPFSLNDVYRAFNYSQKFNELIKDFQNKDFEKIDKEIAETIFESMSFIFDRTKKSNPILYAVFYSMQYMFWEVVIIGGMLKNMKLSAKLLSNSLTLFGKEPEDLTIEDEETVQLLRESEAFDKKIKELIEKYGKETGEFVVNDDLIRFEEGDLLYAIHDAPIFIKAIKNENNTWNLEGEINDTYDFTDFKSLKEYVDKDDSMLTDIFSTLLNNFGVVSSEYGVIKTYEVKIKFKMDNYEIK